MLGGAVTGFDVGVGLAGEVAPSADAAGVFFGLGLGLADAV